MSSCAVLLMVCTWGMGTIGYQISGHIVGIFCILKKIGLKNRPEIYGIGTSNESVPEMAIEVWGIPIIGWYYSSQSVPGESSLLTHSQMKVSIVMGGTPSWMVDFMENPNPKWRIWGYPYDLRKLKKNTCIIYIYNGKCMKIVRLTKKHGCSKRELRISPCWDRDENSPCAVSIIISGVK